MTPPAPTKKSAQIRIRQLSIAQFEVMFPPAIIKRLGRSAGAKSSEQYADFADSLRWAVRTYWSAKQMLTLTGPTELRRTFKPLQAHASELRHGLRTLSHPRKFELALWLLGAMQRRRPKLPQNFGQSFRPVVRELHALTLRLRDLDEALRLMLRNLKREVKPGRKSNRALNNFIQNLGSQCLRLSNFEGGLEISYDPGSRQYFGPFMSIVEECLQRMDPDLRISNNALGEAIRRVHSRKRRNESST